MQLSSSNTSKENAAIISKISGAKEDHHRLFQEKLDEENFSLDKAHMDTYPVKFIFATPERLAKQPAFTAALQNLNARKLLSRFVIDEAHCVSHWGLDFRPDYRKLSALKDNFPDVPITCLTATATPIVRDDVIKLLGLDKVMQFAQFGAEWWLGLKGWEGNG